MCMCAYYAHIAPMWIHTFCVLIPCQRKSHSVTRRSRPCATKMYEFVQKLNFAKNIFLVGCGCVNVCVRNTYERQIPIFMCQTEHSGKVHPKKNEKKNLYCKRDTHTHTFRWKSPLFFRHFGNEKFFYTGLVLLLLLVRKNNNKNSSESTTLSFWELVSRSTKRHSNELLTKVEYVSTISANENNFTISLNDSFHDFIIVCSSFNYMYTYIFNSIRFDRLDGYPTTVYFFFFFVIVEFKIKLNFFFINVNKRVKLKLYTKSVLTHRFDLFVYRYHTPIYRCLVSQ